MGFFNISSNYTYRYVITNWTNKDHAAQEKLSADNALLHC